jgi:DNA invertase Pin-like site-specific DNA recombinase
VDRLGRNYQDVCDTIREFVRRGVLVRTVINSMTFDGSTKDPMRQAVRDALIAFMAAMAQAQTEAKKAAQRAGIDYAKAVSKSYRGRRPSFSRAQFQAARDLVARDERISAIAESTGLSRQTVYRIKRDPANCEAALAVWGM